MRGIGWLAVALVACGGTAESTRPEPTAAPVAPQSDPSNLAKPEPKQPAVAAAAGPLPSNPCGAPGVRLVQFDLDGDGKTDVWKLHEPNPSGGGDYVACKKVDMDRDGSYDYWVAYTPTGTMLYEAFDFDFDGQFDQLTIYDPATGIKTEVRRDTDADGHYDIIETYDAQGNLVSP